MDVSINPYDLRLIAEIVLKLNLPNAGGLTASLHVADFHFFHGQESFSLLFIKGSTPSIKEHLFIQKTYLSILLKSVLCYKNKISNKNSTH